MELLCKNSIGYGEKETIELSWNKFEELSQIIVNDIIANDFHLNHICLLGTARGALPLLTYVSHQTEIRDLSIIQLKMTNSDKPFDYGNVSILLKAIRDDYDKFIILEDIVYKGKTIQRVQEELRKDKKEIIAIYSLIIDEAYKNDFIKNKVKSASILKQNKWVKFPWEKKI